jgi:hypothetical protein
MTGRELLAALNALPADRLDDGVVVGERMDLSLVLVVGDPVNDLYPELVQPIVLGDIHIAT